MDNFDSAVVLGGTNALLRRGNARLLCLVRGHQPVAVGNPGC